MPGIPGMKLLYLRQQFPKLYMESTFPQVEMTRERGQLEIDQTANRRAVGMYSPVELVERLSQLSREAVLEGIGRVAQEGDRAANIHTGEDVIVELSFEAMFRSPGLRLEPPPYEPPRMRYTPERLITHWHMGEIAYRLERGRIVKLWLDDYDVNRDFIRRG